LVLPHSSPSGDFRPKPSLCVCLDSEEMAQAVLPVLRSDRYTLSVFKSVQQLCQFIETEKQTLDCLILQDNAYLPSLTTWLHGQATVLPLIILSDAPGKPQPWDHSFRGGAPPAADGETIPIELVHFVYHTAEIWITPNQLPQIDEWIDQAIARFIALAPNCRLAGCFIELESTPELGSQNLLQLQQQRLTEKLKERLGYLGVYYKRNSQNFLRHLPPDQRQELLDRLKIDYRDIVLCYFANDGSLNQRIDEFVNTAFFTDLPVSQVVEIHMELMDAFSKQLKLEGRSEEILLDYRLTLIDIIAHLCEMYRRSIPRES